MLKSMFLAMLLSLPLSAAAEGSITLNFSPRNAQEADALRLGLTLYALHRDIRSGAAVRQNGTANFGQLSQSGTGHLGIIEQRGSGHAGQLRQTGSNNVFGLFQSGRNTRAQVVQHGQGRTGLIFQHGW